MKKEVSDHLAKVFFESNTAKKKKNEQSFFVYFILSIGVAIVLVFMSTPVLRNKSAVVKSQDEIMRIERYSGPHNLVFDFTKNKEGIASLYIELPEVRLNDYSKIGFKVRMFESQTRHVSAMKVSIVTKRKEVSSLYVRHINRSWKDIVLPFSSFEKISDWSNIAGISFSLEPWNTSAQKGELLIDDIQFLKN